MANRPIHPSFTVTTPIRYLDQDGMGTGFFLNAENETYLVTNRHVLDPEDQSPSRVRIYLRDRPNFVQTNPYDIDISDGAGVDWFGHPDSEDIDVALIPLDPRLDPLDQAEDAKTGSLAFTRNHYIHENVGVDQRVAILGYPGNFVDTETLFPIRRNALIASPYGLPFSGSPLVVTDASMHPGTSGSPVVMQAGGMMRTRGKVPSERNKGTYLLGVHSAEWYRLAEPDQEQGMGGGRYELNAAWYPELIDDILGEVP